MLPRMCDLVVFSVHTQHTGIPQVLPLQEDCQIAKGLGTVYRGWSRAIRGANQAWDVLFCIDYLYQTTSPADFSCRHFPLVRMKEKIETTIHELEAASEQINTTWVSGVVDGLSSKLEPQQPPCKLHGGSFDLPPTFQPGLGWNVSSMLISQRRRRSSDLGQLVFVRHAVWRVVCWGLCLGRSKQLHWKAG